MASVIILTTCCCVFITCVFGLPEHPYPKYPLQFLSETPTDYGNYRLPTSLWPRSYDLKLTPFLNNATFNGCVTIVFSVLYPTDVIVLHMNNDSIPSNTVEASVYSPNQTLTISSWGLNTTYQTASFQLNKNVSTTDAITLRICYRGVLRNDMKGFYLSTYNTSTANHSLAITQFEATAARYAYPCLDEPAFRAKFNISMCRQPNQNSLSNMPLLSSQYDNTTDLVCDMYKETPLMPTYLVAFGVTDLANLTKENFRVFARDSVINDGYYTMSVGPEILNTISNMLNMSYPLPKMDVVAVPDFSAGAMENWGLTTYREKYVLYNPLKNSWMDKFMVFSVIAHEFAHQWFGDLVTPEWWDYAWLNEAFATYFEYVIPDLIMNSSSLAVTDALQPALAMDRGKPRPMTAPVYTPDQIEGSFDYVIYQKGGSILRMFEHCVSSSVWNNGMEMYLKNNQYGSGSPSKLSCAVLDAGTKDNKSMPNFNKTFYDWTTNPGFPLITISQVSTSSENSSNMTIYNITQAPYDMEYNVIYSWNVPLTFTTEKWQEFDAKKCFNQWLLPSEPNSSQIFMNDSGWIVVNVDQIGYFRVNYDDHNWSKLKNQLDRNHSCIGKINRAQIIDDGFHLARTGHISYKQAMDFTSYLPRETEHAPWNAFFNHMKVLINWFYGTSTGDAIKQYAQNIMKRPFNALIANIGQSLSTLEGSITLSKAALFSCSIDLPDCVKLGKNMFEEWRKNKSILILPEVKETVMCTGLRSNPSLGAFMDVMDYFLNSGNGAEKVTLLRALGCVNSPNVAKIYLDVICDSNANYFRLQDRWAAVHNIISQQTGIPFVLQYLVENYQKVNDSLGSSFPSVFHSLAAAMSQNSHFDKVKSIVNDTKVDERLRGMLNSTVIPAFTRHQAWVESKQGLELHSWAMAYLNSSASPVLSLLLLLGIALVTLINSS